MSKRVYYETVRSGLVPVKVLHRIRGEHGGGYMVQVTRNTGPYHKGETFTTSGRWLVNKARSRGFHIMVTQADLSEVPYV